MDFGPLFVRIDLAGTYGLAHERADTGYQLRFGPAVETCIGIGSEIVADFSLSTVLTAAARELRRRDKNSQAGREEDRDSRASRNGEHQEVVWSAHGSSATTWCPVRLQSNRLVAIQFGVVSNRPTATSGSRLLFGCDAERVVSRAEYFGAASVSVPDLLPANFT